jgi:rhodanese-related sulfurtransferase
VSKFIPGLDAVMPPLSGAEGVSLLGFLALDAVGSLLWSGFYVGLGYLFSNELDVAIRWAQRFGTLLGVVIGIPIGFYAGWRGLALVRMVRRLRLRRISPPMLARKLKSNRKVAVLDLLNFEEETDTESLEAIPGAFQVDPSRLQKSPHLTVRDDVEIILYCSSRRDVESARVAVALKRIGIDRVWVLEGGLKAWREQGFPVAHSLEAPEVVAERLGIKLPEPKLGRTGDRDELAN